MAILDIQRALDLQIIIYEQFHCPFLVTSVGEEFMLWGNVQVDLYPL